MMNTISDFKDFLNNKHQIIEIMIKVQAISLDQHRVSKCMLKTLQNNFTYYTNKYKILLKFNVCT